MSKLNYTIYFFLCLFLFSPAIALNEDEQRVIVRTWYSKPIKSTEDGKFEPPESAGHVSLDIPSKKIYLSLWPDSSFLVADPMTQPIRAHFMSSYYHDVLEMGRSADSVVCLYNLNQDKLKNTIASLRRKTKYWLLLSDVIVDNQNDNESHNCATIVLSALLKTLFGENSYTTNESYSGGIGELNDTFFDSQSRSTLLNRMSKNQIAVDEYGINFKAWEESIKQGKPLSPCPKTSLIRLPDTTTPCTVDLWVRNLRERERKNFFVDLVPAYVEAGDIKAINYSFVSREKEIDKWSLLSPFKLIARTFWPWSNSYFSEHLLIMGGSFFISDYLDKKGDKSTIVNAVVNAAVSTFFVSTFNFLGKFITGGIYFYHSKKIVTKTL